jgi:hypothetical protein
VTRNNYALFRHHGGNIIEGFKQQPFRKQSYDQPLPVPRK